MTETEALAYIHSLQPRGIQPGLTRIRAALAALGDPQEKLAVVHIAGTNGKGSTAEMIRCIATAGGYKTALYTSPTITTLADTITINGVPIPPEAFAKCTERVQATDIPLTEFEFTTALALLWFAEQAVDLAIIECGLGGREDATNVFSAPKAAVFTPIALDHTNLLGNSLKDIALQKSGIIKPHCAVVSATKQAPEVLEILQKEATANHTFLHVADSKCKGYNLAMQGTHQQENAQTAATVCRTLHECGFSLSEADIAKGLATAQLPCRQELILRKIPVILDGAHNPQGVSALVETVRDRYQNLPVILLTGMLADKNVEACAALLSPLSDKVICCTPNHPDRALAAESLAAYYPSATAISDPSDAFRAAYTLAKNQNLPLIVSGSFYLAKEIRKMI